MNHMNKNGDLSKRDLEVLFPKRVCFEHTMGFRQSLIQDLGDADDDAAALSHLFKMCVCARR